MVSQSKMREILFLGKRIDNGEWVEGHLLRYENGRARIIPSHIDIFCYENEENRIVTIAYEVIPESIRQFTGHTDKNGKRIWEGDVVRHTNEDGIPAFYEVVWDNEFFAPMLQLVGNCRGFWLPGMNELVEVIGNIHDPELLEVSHA